MDRHRQREVIERGWRRLLEMDTDGEIAGFLRLVDPIVVGGGRHLAVGVRS